MKKIVFIFSLIFLSGILCAQDANNIRVKTIFLTGDTLRFDSLSVVPNSMLITTETGTKINESHYFLDELKTLVHVDNERHKGYVVLHYRVFPIDLSASISNKDSALIQPNLLYENPFTYKVVKENTMQIFDESSLQRNGSISRGMVLGNRQNLSINSDFNLQLSGKLSDNINILANISDDNIPIQAEGNTQQLQEFDNIFIKLFNNQANLTAGDFRVNHSDGHFLRYAKKARGMSYQYQNHAWSDQDSSVYFSAGASVAVSKGKFSKQVFRGVEGNQGPYRMKGAENELFIIVLSGTERVFVDGALMTRGINEDYVIDYNASELTFTSNVLVTKDLRISVEFQYSDKNFARSVLTADVIRAKNNSKWSVNFYSEQDSKNQSLQQDLSEKDRTLLANVGDDLNEAVIQSIDTVVYTDTQVLYQKIDSLGFDSVFVYRPDPEVTNYRLSFSLVGQGNGDYIQDGFTPNGRKFKWVVPDVISGQLVHNGDYQPVRKLISPKRRQFLTARLETKIGEGDMLYVEGSLSSHDQNTFSSHDDGDNVGLGVNVGGVKKVGINANTHLLLLLDHEYRQKQFSIIEQYRPVEFNINWNYTLPALTKDQHLSTFGLSLIKTNKNFLKWRISTLLEGDIYSGNKNDFSVRYKKKSMQVKATASLLNTQGDQKTQFVIQNADISRDFSWLKLGVKDEFRSNIRQSLNSDSLSLTSFEFIDGEVYVTNKDSTARNFKLFYKQRLDKKSNQIVLKDANLSRIYGVQFQGKISKNHHLDLVISNRNLRVVDTTLSSQDAEDTFLGKINYRGKALKNGLSFSTFYDISSGLEPKRQFVYVQVPVGQGVYVWVDYNENGIKELAEFEVAKFQYEADYVRTFTLTNEFQKTFANSFSQTLQISPETWWSDSEGLLKFASRFSNLTSITISRKTNRENSETAFNPFLKSITDSTLINLNSSIREVLFFNKNSLKWGMDFTYAELGSKQLLSNGFEARRNESKKLNIRWNVLRSLRWDQSIEKGLKKSVADYSATRSFDLNYYSLVSTFQYQPGKKYRLKFKGELTTKENESVESFNEVADIRSLGFECRISQAGKGNFQAGIEYINIKYNGVGVSSLTFEMLNGLAVGTNYTWNLLLQRTLMKNLELNFSYNGRVSEDNKAIHSGGMQIRAFF